MKTCTVKQWDSIKSAIDRQYIIRQAKEIRGSERLPESAIYLFTTFLAYGDMNYFVCPDGSYVCEYFDIGD